MKHLVRILCVLLVVCAVLVSCDDSISDVINDGPTPLAVTTAVWIEGGYLCWNSVEYAVGYTVSIDGREKQCQETMYSLAELADGDHVFKVKANADGVNYSSSAFTEPLIVKLTDGAVTRTDTYSQFDDLSESYLGYGFDVIRSAVFSDKFVKLSSPIFKTEEIQKQRLLRVESKYSYVDEIVSSSMEEFASKWNASANVNVSWGGKRVGGSVELSAKYSNTSQSTKSVSYQCVSITNQQFYVVMQSDLATYRNIMTDSFKSDLYSDMSPATLFDRYGTHFITSAVMGGKINSYYLHSSETEQNLSQASAKAAVEVRAWKAKTDVDTSASWREEMASQGINVSNTLEVIGGGDYGMLNAQDVPANYNAWEKSLDTNPSLIGIKDTGSLWAIWELIDPALDTRTYTWIDENGIERSGSRSEQLQAYFYAYGVEAYNSLMEASGLPEMIEPESIVNIKVNGQAPQSSGEYLVYAGVTNDIAFAVLPDGAVGYTKSVALSTQCDYARINEQNQLVIDANAPANALLTVVVSAGGVRTEIHVRIRQTYTIEYMTRYPGVTVETETGVLYGEMLLRPMMPSRPGYTLIGWFTDAAGTDEWDFMNDFVESNMTLYAKWEEYNPTITFYDNVNSGSMEPVKVPYNTAFTRPMAPILLGYTFGGFYSGSDMVREFDFSQLITEDTAIYVKWLPDVKVTFYSNVAVYSKDAEQIPYNTLFEQPATPILDGYSFGGWYVDSAYTVEFDFTQRLTQNATVYMLWYRNPKVNFYSNAEGFSKDAVTLPYNTAMTPPATPILSGYTFGGWYSDYAFTTAFDFAKKITEDTVIYVKWNANPVVSFSSAVSGFAMDAVKVPYNTSMDEPTAPTLANYTFDGWYADAVCLTPFDFDQLLTKNTVIYAKYTPVNYTVQYNSNGGSTIAAQTLPYGSAMPEPNAAPTKNGAWFAGWYYDIALQRPVDFANDKVSGAMTLYAAWKDKEVYTINFASNGGAAVNDIFVEEGSTTVIQLPSITRTGYRFDGWYSDASFNEQDMVTDRVFTSSVTLYAKWTVLSYNVSYNFGDGATSGSYTTDYTVEDEVKLPVVAHKNHPTHYSFVGWFENAECTIVFANDLNTNPRNVVLYAKFEPITYTITYVGGTSVLSGNYTKSYTIEDDAITLPGVAHGTAAAHYSFKGWYEDSSFSKAFANDLLSNPRNVVLYPKLEAVTYAITYHFNGGTASGSYTTTYTVENKTIVIPTPTYGKQYRFEAWYINTALTQGFTNDLLTNPRNVHLYAKWIDLTCVVTLNPNGGTISSTSATVYKDSAYGMLPEPARTGHKFEGWFTATTGGVRIYETTPVTASGNHTLYAQWSKNQYTITFNANGGSVSKSSTDVYYGDRYGEGSGGWPTPTRTNYAFAGWYTAASGGTKVDKTTVMNKENAHTLYAQWLATTETFVANMENGMRNEDNYYVMAAGVLLLKVDKAWYEGNEKVAIVVDDDDAEYIEYFGPNTLDFDYLKQLGYTKIKITLTMDIQELNDGYQEFYMYDKGSGAELWKKTDVEHTPGDCDPYWASHTFATTINIDALTGQGIKMVYGANGKDDDSWQLGETIIEFEVIK